jgi:hypothetical protein
MKMFSSGHFHVFRHTAEMSIFSCRHARALRPGLPAHARSLWAILPARKLIANLLNLYQTDLNNQAKLN